MLLAAAGMFLSLTALTAAGRSRLRAYRPTPSSSARDHATDRVADRRTAAAQRLTPVAGLGTLATIGGALAALLLPSPDATPPAGRPPATLPPASAIVRPKQRLARSGEVAPHQAPPRP